MTLTPDQLREAADLLCQNTGLYFNDASARLLAEADRRERATKEVQFKADIGRHWADYMRKKYRWSITSAGTLEYEKFGEAAIEAVKAHTEQIFIPKEQYR